MGSVVVKIKQEFITRNEASSATFCAVCGLYGSPAGKQSSCGNAGGPLDPEPTVGFSGAGESP